MRCSLAEIAKAIGGRLVGDAATYVGGVASFASARAGDLVFAEHAVHLDAALRSAASAVVAGDFADGATGKALVIVKNPRLAFARAAVLLREGEQRPVGIHPLAVVHPSARIGAGVSVDARAVIAEDAVLGEGCRVGAGAVVGRGVRLGTDCEVYPNVTIYPATSIGDRVVIHAGAVLGSDGFGYVRDGETGRYEKSPQIGTLRIEDDVEIGANTTIDRGALDATVIGRGSKLDNLVHVGHNVVIGENVVVAAQVGISGSSTIEDGVVIAGQVGIGDHARVGAGVILGGQCGVLPQKIVRGPGEMFWGTPARPLREYLRSVAALARLGKKR